MAMTLRLTESQDQLLEQIAEQLGCSKHQAVIKAIEAFDAKAHRKKQLDEIINIVLVRDKELLDRLADA
ncbi:MAG: CopG family transcriptional regulator [Actinobacteria bacterium]|jgi:hypothetical protein|nr:CopG family transcriptional regulator [Actinomycetota bacterium]